MLKSALKISSMYDRMTDEFFWWVIDPLTIDFNICLPITIIISSTNKVECFLTQPNEDQPIKVMDIDWNIYRYLYDLIATLLYNEL